MPSHAGHAPWGPLNENMRGSMGGNEMPHSMHAKRSLIQMGSPPSPGSTRRRPSPILRASSTESVTRPFQAVLQDDAVDDDVEIVRPRAIEDDLVAEVDHLTVDARADEPFAPESIEFELELPLARARRWAREA